MHFYPHAGRIPEGYRKVNRSVNRSVNRPVNRPVNGPVNRPVKRPVNKPVNSRAQTRKLRQAWRLGPPEGYRKDSRPFW
jgi:hypothetical protein